MSTETKLVRKAVNALDGCESVFDEFPRYAIRMSKAADGLMIAHMNEAIANAIGVGLDVGGNKPTSTETVNDARVVMLAELDTCERMCADATAKITELQRACAAARAAIGPVTRTVASVSPEIANGSTITVDMNLIHGQCKQPIFTWNAKTKKYIKYEKLDGTGWYGDGCSTLIHGGYTYVIKYQPCGKVTSMIARHTATGDEVIVRWSHANVSA